MIRFERGRAWIEVWVAPGGVMERGGDRDGDKPPAVVEGEPGMPERPRDLYDALVARYLERGWRLATARTGLDDAEHGEPRDPALEAAMRAHFDDTAPVYADWLQQRGHPRGALMAMQLARAAADTPELAAEEAGLLAAHADVLLGPLAAWTGSEPNEGLELSWRAGFLHRARLGRHDSAVHILGELLRHPSARFLHDLVIGATTRGDQDFRVLSERLLYTSPTPPLRRLYLGDVDDSYRDGASISRTPLGDLDGLGDVYPELEDVVLKGRGDLGLGELALPRARRFALRTSTMTRDSLDRILRAPWPQLEDLELWFGDPRIQLGAEITPRDAPDALSRLLAADGVPHLRTLRLMNASFADAIPWMLSDAPIAAQLETLDVSLGAFGDAGARRLCEVRDAFPRLRTLKLAECFLDDSSLAELRDLGVDVDDTPISPARNPSRVKYARYTSVNE